MLQKSLIAAFLLLLPIACFFPVHLRHFFSLESAKDVKQQVIAKIIDDDFLLEVV